MAAFISLPVTPQTAALLHKHRSNSALLDAAATCVHAVVAAHDKALELDRPVDPVEEVRTCLADVMNEIKSMQQAQECAQRSEYARLSDGLLEIRSALADTRDHILLKSADTTRKATREALGSAMSSETLQTPMKTAFESTTLARRFDVLQANLQSVSASLQAQLDARSDALQGTVQSVAAAVHATHADTQEMRRSVEKANAAKSNSSLRGARAEDYLYQVLQSRLLQSEGWDIERVGKEAHSCDLLVTRTGWPRVRIESKCKLRLDKGDMDKFRRDLNSTGDHGLLVSLSAADIPGRARGATFERLDTCSGARWQGTLTVGHMKDAPGAEDVDLAQVTSAISAIQTLGSLLETVSQAREDAAGTPGSTVIFAEDIDKFKLELGRASDDVASARARLKSSIQDSTAALQCLNRVVLSRVGSTVTGCLEEASASAAGRCRFCSQEFKTMHGLRKHENDTCKKRAS